MNLMRWIDQRKHWWKVFLIIFAVSVAVVGYIGAKTYEYAPPMCDFVDPAGNLVFSAEDIVAGQKLFFRYGLMDYGSFLGDGGMRGPDFTAEALHQTALAMNRSYEERWKDRFADEATRRSLVEAMVQRELKQNRYDPDYYRKKGNVRETKYAPGAVVLTEAQAEAFRHVVAYYGEKFGSGGERVGRETFRPAHYITDPAEIRSLSAFFFWGGWLSAAERPGYPYSYTHNWPYDPLAGNTPHGGLVLW
ncbi:MAG: nitric-oxide reductase, partial [Planctomycetota bacterium]